MPADVCHGIGCDQPLAPQKGRGRRRKWCSERCRKVTLYSGECRDCGARINTSGDVARRSERCNSCANQHKIDQSRRWILDSVAEWVELFGTPPSAVDWNPSQARANPYMAWKAERHERTGRPWPWPTLVRTIFGTWNAGLEAAGFPPVKPGEYRDGRSVRDIGHDNRGPRKWDREAILDAVEAWRRKTGVVPTTHSWMFAADDHPTAQTARKAFGSWLAMLEAWHSERFTPALADAEFAPRTHVPSESAAEEAA